MSINLSSNARTGLTVLRNVADQMATTQSRLVTGKAVNSPLDNVSKFFTASSMDTRAASIDALMDNINNAQSTMKAASEGIKGIQGLIKEARSLTSQALTSTQLTNAKVTGTAALTGSTAIADGAGITLTTASGTVTYTAAGGTGTVQGAIDAINADTDVGVKASLVDGKFTLTGSNNETITTAAVGGGLTTLGLTAGATAAKNTTREALSKQFDALRTEIDRIAKDAGINGTNLLTGDKIKLALNENGTSSTSIDGTTVSATSLNIGASAGTWQTDTNINASLDALIAAGSSLEATSASFASNQSIINARKDFNASLSDILKSSSAKLTAADMDQEAANLVALQTRQQMATTALSIMQSSETTALRLIS